MPLDNINSSLTVSQVSLSSLSTELQIVLYLSYEHPQRVTIASSNFLLFTLIVKSPISRAVKI